jgi:hypothetical protein
MGTMRIGLVKSSCEAMDGTGIFFRYWNVYDDEGRSKPRSPRAQKTRGFMPSPTTSAERFMLTMLDDSRPETESMSHAARVLRRALDSYSLLAPRGCTQVAYG